MFFELFQQRGTVIKKVLHEINILVSERNHSFLIMQIKPNIHLKQVVAVKLQAFSFQLHVFSRNFALILRTSINLHLFHFVLYVLSDSSNSVKQQMLAKYDYSQYLKLKQIPLLFFTFLLLVVLLPLAQLLELRGNIEKPHSSE